MDQQILEKLGAYLEDCARKQTPIFYGDLARSFHLPPVTEYWSAHPLCDLFGELDGEDDAAGRPFRTALVISKEFSIPGDGFFKALHAHRGTPHPLSDDLKMTLWADEYKKLITYHSKLPAE